MSKTPQINVIYNTIVLKNDGSSFDASMSFDLKKTIVCSNSDERDILIEKLQRLQKEDFNRVHIPDFTFTYEGNTVTQYVQFIKGKPIGTIAHPYNQIIYQDIVLRGSEWTFLDYNSQNFVVESVTDKIYAIDFQSYAMLKNIKERKNIWHEKIELQKSLLKFN